MQRTAALWPDAIYAWRCVRAATRILRNDVGNDARMVQRRFDGLTGAMSRHAHHAGTLSWAQEHFVHVARSWHTGLFHRYANAELPRTTNNLE